MPKGSLNYHINTIVTEIHQDQKVVMTSDGKTVPYDILVLATGSDALLPRHTPGHDAKGVFVYRNVDDIHRLITFSATRTGTVGAVVGGGLLGLEAAKAMMDLEEFKKVKLIERNRWVLSRQLDSDAGGMVVEQVRELGVDVLLSKRVGKIMTDSDNSVTGVTFEDGEKMECSCICFAVSLTPRLDWSGTGSDFYRRLVSRLAMSLLEKLASNAPTVAAESSLELICRLPPLIFTPLGSVLAGKTPPSDLLHLVWKWQTYSHLTLLRPRRTKHESLNDRI